jgi:peptide chain release factor 3
VYDLEANSVLLYERVARGERTAPVAVTDPHDPSVERLIGRQRQKDLVEAAAMISGAGTRFDLEAYRRERLTPVFFGSALNDFGVEPFLRALLTLAPSPVPRLSDDCLVSPTDPDFSGFVFKIQANMNPRHRDRVAFVRICSGQLTKDMSVTNERLGTSLRLSRVYRFFGRDRETVPEAFPGDVVGIVNPGRLAIGDTLYAGQRVRFAAIPQFPAERFAYLRPTGGRHKRFDAAVSQLEEEGLMQVFTPQTGVRHPIIGVVGSLQFDVVEARLQSEYGIQCSIDALPYVAARWPVRDPADAGTTLAGSGSATVRDRLDREVILFESAWELRYVQEKNPRVNFRDSM